MSADIPLSGASFDAAELAAALFDDPPPAPVPVTIAAAPPPVVVLPVAVAVPQPVPQPPREAMPPTPIQAPTAMADEPLLAPQAAALASQALASLQEAVRPSPPPAEMRLLRSGGPTIEDLVRDELRGQLKLWLDTHLPPMVERLVRQEIERLVRPG